jgi:pyrroloquinoline quinone biosynthesis protein B
MKIKILGSAAGGGFPQWNCNCVQCLGYRQGLNESTSRTQSSAAVKGIGDQWVLLNASPDIRSQVEQFIPLSADAPIRSSPIAAVVLTDSQLDHVSGLLFLREGRVKLIVYCTDQVYEDLMVGFPVFKILESYCGVERRLLSIEGDYFEIPEAPGVKFKAIPVSGKAPPYSPHRGNETQGHNVALTIMCSKSGKTAFYAPGLETSTVQGVDQVLDESDLIMADGSFWSEEELITSGCGKKTASEMGHLAIGGHTGMMEYLSRYKKSRKILVHINNTNPILDEHSQERKYLLNRGIEVGLDGLEIELS